MYLVGRRGDIDREAVGPDDGLSLTGALTEQPIRRHHNVVHAVLDAIAAGYRVYVPVDACGGMSCRTEDAAFRQIEAVGGVTTSVVTLVTALAPDFSTDLGGKTFGILQSLRLAGSNSVGASRHQECRP